MLVHRSAVVVVLALVAALLTAGFGLAPANSQTAKFIIVQSTTSTEDSGLFKHILPMFTRKSGIEVRVVAVGTGHAIKNASNGDGDVLFVHDKPSEEKFVAEGDGVKQIVRKRHPSNCGCPSDKHSGARFLSDSCAACSHGNCGAESRAAQVAQSASRSSSYARRAA
jgi:tungstate transport system substrate-binding protein